MPTNRPFFANFLAAFRAHSAIAKASTTTSVSTSTVTSASQFSSLTSNTTSAARTIAAKSTPPSTTATSTTVAVQAANHLSHTRHASTSPPSRSPPAASFSRTQRRGSDSSSEGGFRDALSGEKWYVGGRTAAGEERFYRLGVVKKERSGDRLSIDRLSL